MASGGVRLYVKGLVAQIAGAGLGLTLFGWDPVWSATMTEVLACVPFLAVHPLAVGAMTFAFAQRLHEQKIRLESLSRMDGLTGLYNRRYWQMRALEEYERCQRSESQAVLLMMDIDHFKKINDQYGHSAGDRVLQSFAATLQSHLRSTDLIGRFGGEEFAAVLVDTDLAAVKPLVERLREIVAEQHAGQPSVLYTISIGAASLSRKTSTFIQWLNAADAALYEAKAGGRDRCCFSLGLADEEKPRGSH